LQSYTHWGGGWGAFAYDAPFLKAALAHGSTPVITWMSGDPTTTDQSAYAPSRIAAGAWDSYAKSWADGLRALGKPVMLRLDPEMNGNWCSYSPGVDGTTATDYVAAWQHLHKLFLAEGATNVRWVWSPNVEYNGSTPLPSLYPGDAYVDWVALDGYNWGNTNGHIWQSYTSVFSQSLSDLKALTSKPIMLAEVASSTVGGSKSTWITNMFKQLLLHPEIKAFIWFDLNKETDWAITSSSASASAFGAGFAARPAYTIR
jgi:beta-mannanase